MVGGWAEVRVWEVWVRVVWTWVVWSWVGGGWRSGRGRERGEPGCGSRVDGLEAVGGRVRHAGDRSRAGSPAVPGSGVRHFPINPVMVGGDRVRGRVAASESGGRLRR